MKIRGKKCCPAGDFKEKKTKYLKKERRDMQVNGLGYRQTVGAVVGRGKRVTNGF